MNSYVGAEAVLKEDNMFSAKDVKKIKKIGEFFFIREVKEALHLTGDCSVNEGNDAFSSSYVRALQQHDVWNKGEENRSASMTFRATMTGWIWKGLLNSAQKSKHLPLP